jgi:hypothetical protein
VCTENIASKQSKKRKAALDWYGAPYDPDEVATASTIKRGGSI